MSKKDALTKAAQAAEKSGDYESAFQAWHKLASEVRSPVVYCQLGRVAQILKRWAHAEEAFLDALAIDSRLAAAMLALGYLYLARTDGDRTGNARAARMWLLRALEIDLTAPALSLLGAAYYALGEKYEAREAYRATIEFDGAYQEAYSALGFLEAKEGNDSEAEELLQRAIQLDPVDVRAHQRLGVLLHKRGRHSEAEREFRRCIEIDPSDYFSRLYLANTLAVQGREAEAEEHYRTAIAVRPGQEPAIKLFANYLESLSRKEEAAELRSQLSQNGGGPPHRQGFESDKD